MNSRELVLIWLSDLDEVQTCLNKKLTLNCCAKALDPQDGCHSCQMREIFAHVLPNSQNFVRNVRNMTNVTNVNKSRLSWEHNSDSQNFTVLLYSSTRATFLGRLV